MWPPDKEDSPPIQCWSIADAPSAIKQALPTSATIEWIAQIPPQLQNDAVFALLTQGSGMHEVLCQGYLPDGSYMIAGSSAHQFICSSRRSSTSSIPKLNKVLAGNKLRK